MAKGTRKRVAMHSKRGDGENQGLDPDVDVNGTRGSEA